MASTAVDKFLQAIENAAIPGVRCLERGRHPGRDGAELADAQGWRGRDPR